MKRELRRSKIYLTAGLACACVSTGFQARGQEPPKPAGGSVENSPSTEPGTDHPRTEIAPPKADCTELEREFERTMTGSRLEGVWQMTGEGGLSGDRVLTPPREEAYVISKVSKMDGDRWLVFARITFADKDVNVPVPVRVVWAGDTAVITLDDIGVPMIGTYSARVLVHHGFYSGVWYSNAKNYGGVMAGRIVRLAEPENPPTPPPGSK